MISRFSAVIGAKITEFMSRMRLVRETIRSSARDVRVDIGADVSRFNRRMAEIQARIAALIRDKVIVKIEARIENFQRQIQRIATNIRAFGELMQHTLMGSIMAVLPMIAPLIANIGVAIANLGPMIGTVVGSTFALVGAFAAAGAAAVAFTAVAIPTIKDLFNETGPPFTALQKKAWNTFESVKGTYRSLVKETETPVLKAFTSAMQVANSLLIKLRPLFLSSAQAVANLMAQLNTAIGTPPIQNFLDYLNTTGAPMLETLARSIGNVFKGLFSMLTAFAPLTATTAKGFEDMTARFAEWANGLSGSAKFQAFMDYVNTNMPKIRAIFRDATAGLIYFFAAFGGSSSDMMTGLANMMARFKEWSASLSQNQGFQTFLSYVQQTAPGVLQLIGNLTTFLVNLGIGMAPVGAGLMNIVNRFLEFMNSGMESNRIIGVLLASFISIGGVLLAVVPNIIAFRELFKGLGPAISGGLGKALTFVTGLFTNFSATIAPLGAKIIATAAKVGRAIGLITSPVGLVIMAIGALIAIFIKMYKTNEEFRNNVDKAWKAIKEVISSVVKEILSVVTSVWGKVTKFWEENQESIMKIVNIAWKLIQDWINFALNNILAIFQMVWPIISGVVEVAWNLIKTAVKIGIDLVLGIIQTVMKLINGDWEGAWNTIKSTGESIWNSIVGFFEKVNLWDIGVNIIKGLLDGINSMWENVKKAAAGIADLIPDWLKKKLGIHSPSRVMASEAKWIPAGVAQGVYNNLDYIKRSADAMAKAAIPDFKQSLDSTAQTMEAARKVVSAKLREINGEVETIEKEYAAKRAEIIKKNQDKINDLEKKARSKNVETQAKARDKNKKLTAAQNRQILKTTAEQQRNVLKLQKQEAAELEKLEKEKGKKIQAVREKSEKEKFEALKQYAEQQIGLEKWSAKEQASYWQYISKTFKEGTDERIQAQIEYNKAMAELTSEQFGKEQNYVERRKKYNLMSLTQELKAYEKYVKGYKVGSEERIYYEDKIAETKQEIHNRLMTLNDDYISKIKETQQAEIDGIKDIQKAYQDAEDARTQSIASFMSIFDEFERKTDVVGSKLIENLRSQVDAMRDWATDLQMLAAKGIDKGLIEELQAIGPSAQAEIAALNQLSAGELNEFENLWKEKTKIARERAQFELTGQRKDMTDQIEKLQTETKSKLEQYKNEWVEQVKQIRDGTKNEFNPMISSMKEIGINAIEGLRNGLASQVPALQTQANEIANTIDKTIRKALQIKSPSRVLEKLGIFSGQGITQGLASTKGILTDAVRGLTDIMQTDISAASIGLSTALNGGIDSQLLNSYELTSSQDQIGILRQIAGLLSQLDLTVELDGNVISEHVDKNRGRRLTSRRTTTGQGV
ncbi:hypothetical protein ABFY60_15535 [Lysinibacillus pakistanensis]|uniref:phage tail protein n=1 Tax=Lysinibacillus pakistanensis TaxID=759811 RepID=UPI003D2AC83A